MNLPSTLSVDAKSLLFALLDSPLSKLPKKFLDATDSKRGIMSQPSSTDCQKQSYQTLREGIVKFSPAN